jgi:vibriolysin
MTLAATQERSDAMNRTFARPTLVSSALCLAAACGGDSAAPIVTEPVRHAEVDLTPVGADLAADAVIYAGERVGLADGDELEVLSVRRGPDGLRHVRLRQVHRGVPVFGTEIAVHADATTYLGFAGRMTRNLGDMDLAPLVDRSGALATARAERGGGDITYDRERATLFVRPRGPAGADLVWHVELINRWQPAAAAAAWNIVLDAGTGAVVARYDALPNLEQGSGPGGNDKVSWTWNAELDLEEDGGEYWMETDRLRTLDGASNDEVVHGPALDNMEDKAANDAHGFSEVTLAMMSEWVGQNSLDGNGFVIVSRVHDTSACGPDNACWYLEQMHYGDGTPGATFYPLSGGVDVVGHELNHGFTDFHSNLVYAKQSGGLNESFSDIAGAMVEFYREGDRADFLVGEDIMIGDRPLRDMCDPPSDGASIDHVSDYWQGGQFPDAMDPHFSSGVGNKAFCLAVGRSMARGATAVESVRRIGTAWYAANAGYWTSTSTFDEACRGIVDAARALGFSDEEVTEVAQSWADVGAVCGSDPAGAPGGVCDDDGSCEVADGETCTSCADCGGCEECGPYQLAKCRLGLGDCSACGGDGAAGCGDGVCSESEDDASCGVDCGCAADDACGWPAPFGCWCDAECEMSGDCCADIDVCGWP